MGEIDGKMLEFWEILEIYIKVKLKILVWGGDVLSELTVVIVLQYVHISNQHAMHLKLNPMLYVSYIPIKLEKIQKIFHFHDMWLTNLILARNSVWLIRTPEFLTVKKSHFMQYDHLFLFWHDFFFSIFQCGMSVHLPSKNSKPALFSLGSSGVEQKR